MRPAPRRARIAAVAMCVGASATGLLAGCSAGDDEVDRPVVAFLGGADRDGRHYEADAAALRDALRADCEDCEYAAFDAGGDPEVQADQMAQVLEGGADVVLLEAVDAEEGEESLTTADGVPVITMDRYVPGAAYHVGYDPRRAGRLLARTSLEAAGGGDGPTGVLLLGAGRGDLAGEDTTRSAREALTGRGAEILAEDSPEVAGAEEAQSWVADQIDERPLDAVDLVVASGERQAEGAAAAYDAADVPIGERPAIAGVGADLGSLRRLILEQQAVALREPRDAMVRRVVATAAEVLEGAPVTDTVDEGGVPSFLGAPDPVDLVNLTTVMVGGGVVGIDELCEGETAEACARFGIS